MPITDRGEDERDDHVRQAFSLLSHETRLDIVEYLRDTDTPASYAEIKNGIGVRDSGRFNYHLGELEGTFVTETEAGYALSFSANALYQTILATRPLDEHPDIELEPEESCPECGTTFDVCYETEFLVSRCPECETQRFGYPFPPGGFDDRTDEEVLRAAVQRMYHHISLARRGVCPFCSGVMAAAWTTDHDAPFSASVLVLYSCSRCDMTLHVGPAVLAQHDATVASLFDRYGMDPLELLPWEYREHVDSSELTVRGEEPFRVAVPVDIDGDEYVLLVSEQDDGIDVSAKSPS